MKAFVYLDNDRNLGVRDAEFIESDPGFWGRNRHLIDIVWSIDTEDIEVMKRLLFSFKSLELRELQVRELCSQIGFPLKEFLLENKPPSTVFPLPKL